MHRRAVRFISAVGPAAPWRAGPGTVELAGGPARRHFGPLALWHSWRFSPADGGPGFRLWRAGLSWGTGGCVSCAGLSRGGPRRGQVPGIVRGLVSRWAGEHVTRPDQAGWHRRALPGTCGRVSTWPCYSASGGAWHALALSDIGGRGNRCAATAVQGPVWACWHCRALPGTREGRVSPCACGHVAMWPVSESTPGMPERARLCHHPFWPVAPRTETPQAQGLRLPTCPPVPGLGRNVKSDGVVARGGRSGGRLASSRSPGRMPLDRRVRGSPSTAP